MSKQAGKMFHPINGASENIYTGFSWPCLFLGCFWYLYKGMGLWTIITLLVALMTAGVSWFIFPFFANKHHTDSLIKKGYLTQLQYDELKSNKPSTNNINAADELIKLNQLKENGIINQEEFDKLKYKLI